MHNKVFTVRLHSLGNAGDCFSHLSVQVGSDPRRVHFHGDAFWQWGRSCLRNHDKNCSWSQALHDSLRGVAPLHSGDSLAVLTTDPDHGKVLQLVRDVDNGRKLPTDPTPFPGAP